MYMKSNSKILNILIFSFPLFFISLMVWLRINHYPIYEVIGLEDHIIEYSQFFFFLSGGILSFLIALKFRKSCKLMFILFLCVAFGLIVIAGEEVSWGERIFDIETHEIFDGKTKIPVLKYNVQGEMNLHNFKPIHQAVGYLYLMAGSYFIFAWPLIKILNRYFKIPRKIKTHLPYLIPSPILFFYFLPLIINLVDREQRGLAPQDFEMVEFLFSLGILIFLIFIYNHSSNLSPKGQE
jgi:hypothetical protein